MPVISHTESGPENGGNFECGWADQCLQAHIISDVGRTRSHNEDSCILCAPEDKTLAKERGIMLAIADGMGGASAGEYASRLSLTVLTEDYYADVAGSIPLRLNRAIARANTRVYLEGEENSEYQGMGTTLSSLTIVGDCAYIAHVGDSRVYISRGDRLVQITEDHSLVAEQVRSGIISEEEARTHSLKNLITRAVGIKGDVEADLLSLRIQRDDMFLICSDGLNNMVEDDDIADSLHASTLQGIARVLVGKALEGGGSDNISVAMLRVAQLPPKSELHVGCEEVEPFDDSLFNKLKKLVK